MSKRQVFSAFAVLGVAALAAGAVTHAAPPSPPLFIWSTVVNNNDLIPPLNVRNFNSYNQPSVNKRGLVVIRARSRGGPPFGPATHGIYTRDMSLGDVPTMPIVRILDRTTLVPEPNNLGTTFVETPSFPRIDMGSDAIATRGNHQPVWTYGSEGDETRAGTTGIYVNPFGSLITGAAKLGDVPHFSFFGVPEFPGTRFEVFPGSPSVTRGGTIVFKGNYTVSGGETGVYYRDLEDAPITLEDGTKLAPAGGESPVVLIANNTHTLIPGTNQAFGSTSPPSAVGHRAVFAGFDNEQNPSLGGLYLAPLTGTEPPLTTLVRIGDRVPGESVNSKFTRLGEGAAFDSRYVGFWGAWGTVTVTDPASGQADCVSGCREVVVHCPTEGNKDRIAFCLEQCPEPAGCTVQVPLKQGLFVRDTAPGGGTRTVAKTGARFQEFLFWNFSGKVPGVGQGDEGGDDDGEPARWRSSAFVAVSGLYTAFKAVAGDVVGIYLNRQPGQQVFTVLDTRTDGQAIDPEAPAGSTPTELGLEREGLRGPWLAVSAKMGIQGGTEEEGIAGIYLTHLP
jgi:hypothetical protein